MDHRGDRVAIDVEDLTRTFTVGRRAKRRTIEAVSGITFSVDRGERLAFIGPNGAGKSTSIKMLTGILHPTSGRASVLGLTPWDDREQLAHRIGTVFGQRSQLWVELPPRATLRTLGAVYGLDRPVLERRIAELGEQLEAAELFDQPVRTLSLGQRMRCELAACLLHSPDLLFLDEPSIGLDLVAKQQFRELLVELNQELGSTIFLTSHDVADIEHVADRAVIVNHGVIIYDDTVQAMRSTLLRTKQIDVSFDGLIPPERLDRLADGKALTVLDHTANTARLEVDTSRTPIREVLNLLLTGEPVVDLTVVDPPLEHVISEIYQRPSHVDH